MSKKRYSANEITRENIDISDDEDEESVERTLFKKADDSTLKARRFLRPRKSFSVMETTTSSSVPDYKSIFSQFSGFENTQSHNNQDPSNSISKLVGSENTSHTINQTSRPQSHINADRSEKLILNLNEENEEEIVSKIKGKYGETEKPSGSLLPVFQDYEKHIKDIKSELGLVDDEPINSESIHKTSSSSSSSTILIKNATQNSSSNFNANSKENVGDDFSVNEDDVSTTASSKVMNHIDKSGDDDDFGCSLPYYTTRAKLFYQHNGEWKERGLGDIKVSKSKVNSDKQCHLFMREDSSPSRVLLNMMIPFSLPISRTGKNNITLVCPPNPVIHYNDDPNVSVPMLIRVKSSKLADDLLKAMTKVEMD